MSAGLSEFTGIATLNIKINKDNQEIKGFHFLGDTRSLKVA